MRPFLQRHFYVQKHVYMRNGIYYFRLDIPSDLNRYFPASEVKRSLKTSDPTIAKIAAKSLELKALQVYAMLRVGVLSDEIVSQLVKSVMPETRKTANSCDKGKLLSNVIMTYTEEKKGGWTDKTKLEVSGVFKLLVDLLGDIEVTSISRPMLIALRSSLLRVPPNFYKKNPGQSITEFLKSSTETGISSKSVNKHMSRIGSLLKYCHEQGLIASNPATGLQIAEKQRADQERSAYSHDDVKSIVLNLPVEVSVPERYWIPIIGLYSGMRLAEICQLHIEDIIKVDDCWCFDINDAGNKQLKNDASVRIIPVHPKLIELGFIRYFEAMRDTERPRLWMNLSYIRLHGYTNSFGKWYQRYNREYVTEDSKKVFHSMRHLVTDTLKQAGVLESIIAEIVGHTNEGSETMGRYGKRYRPKVLIEALRKLEY